MHSTCHSGQSSSFKGRYSSDKLRYGMLWCVASHYMTSLVISTCHWVERLRSTVNGILIEPCIERSATRCHTTRHIIMVLTGERVIQPCSLRNRNYVVLAYSKTATDLYGERVCNPAAKANSLCVLPCRPRDSGIEPRAPGWRSRCLTNSTITDAREYNLGFEPGL